MKLAFQLLLQSRKAIVAVISILAAALVAVVGEWRGLSNESLLGVIGAITGISWKLMGTIADEDNAQRLLDTAHDEAHG